MTRTQIKADKWMAKVRAWAASHPQRAHVVDDSRESIYGDRDCCGTESAMDYVDMKLADHDTRLDLHREQLDVLQARLSAYESKLDAVKSDNEIAIEELHNRLLKATELANEAIDSSTRLGKLVAELEGDGVWD